MYYSAFPYISFSDFPGFNFSPRLQLCIYLESEQLLPLEVFALQALQGPPTKWSEE